MTRYAILEEIRAIDARVYRPPLAPSESAELMRCRRALLVMLAPIQKSPRVIGGSGGGSRYIRGICTTKVQ